MWQCALHPPHLINVATLPCESQNTENVILQWDITKGKQQSVHEAKIHDIDDLQKRLMQTCFDFDRNVINAGMTI